MNCFSNSFLMFNHLIGWFYFMFTEINVVCFNPSVIFTLHYPPRDQLIWLRAEVTQEKKGLGEKNKRAIIVIVSL